MMAYNMDEYGDVLSPKDVHDILHIGYNKTYDLLKSGELPSLKIGRVRKIPKQCLIDFLNNNVNNCNT